VPYCSGFAPPSTILRRAKPRGSIAKGLHQRPAPPSDLHFEDGRPFRDDARAHLVDGVKDPGPGQSLELLLCSLLEGDSRSRGELMRGGRNEDLPGGCRG
jgi:hypothetical protein